MELKTQREWKAQTVGSYVGAFRKYCTIRLQLPTVIQNARFMNPALPENLNVNELLPQYYSTLKFIKMDTVDEDETNLEESDLTKIWWKAIENAQYKHPSRREVEDAIKEWSESAAPNTKEGRQVGKKSKRITGNTKEISNQPNRVDLENLEGEENEDSKRQKTMSENIAQFDESLSLEFNAEGRLLPETILPEEIVTPTTNISEERGIPPPLSSSIATLNDIFLALDKPKQVNKSTRTKLVNNLQNLVRQLISDEDFYKNFSRLLQDEEVLQEQAYLSRFKF